MRLVFAVACAALAVLPAHAEKLPTPSPDTCFMKSIVADMFAADLQKALDANDGAEMKKVTAQLNKSREGLEECVGLYGCEKSQKAFNAGTVPEEAMSDYSEAMGFVLKTCGYD